jgi:hypothetical protein
MADGGAQLCHFALQPRDALAQVLSPVRRSGASC